MINNRLKMGTYSNIAIFCDMRKAPGYTIQYKISHTDEKAE